MKQIIILASLFIMQLSYGLTGLMVGQKAPEIDLKTVNQEAFVLSKQSKTTVLVFYRGSWCPYCMNQLKELTTDLYPKLNLSKQQVVAISVDLPKVAGKMKKKFKIPYIVISNPKATILKSYNLVNTLNDDLVKKYKSSYKIDVERDSGEKHHMIAHPAVIIVRKGTVIYNDVHTNYKERTKIKDILKALKK
jgi:peroxiredoxin